MFGPAPAYAMRSFLRVASMLPIASYPKSSVWLFARHAKFIPAFLRTATFFESVRKWKTLYVADQGSPTSDITHSRFIARKSASLNRGRVSPQGYSGGSSFSASLTSRPSIASPTNNSFIVPFHLYPSPFQGRGAGG